MIVYPEKIKLELGNDVWLLICSTKDGNKYEIELEKNLNNPIIEHHRQHQTFALLNPEE